MVPSYEIFYLDDHCICFKNSIHKAVKVLECYAQVKYLLDGIQYVTFIFSVIERNMLLFENSRL